MRSLLEKLYRSPFGRIMSATASLVSKIHQPFMIYGYHDKKSGKFHKYSRISSAAVIVNKRSLQMADLVWVSHFAVLDATEGLAIGEGCHIGAWAGIYSHGAEYAIRLLGREYVHIHHSERKGYTTGSVAIGPYTFVGMQSLILPGVTVGKGCLITPGSIVNKDVPDYAVVAGRPAKVVGSTIDLDSKKLEEFDCSETYYDKNALEMTKEKI